MSNPVYPLATSTAFSPSKPADAAPSRFAHNQQEFAVGQSGEGIVDTAVDGGRIENLCIACFHACHQFTRFVGGICGVGFVIAWLATIPVLQLLTLGFFVEATRRVTASGRMRDGLVGREKGWFLAKLMLGVALSLAPLIMFSAMRYDAWLIDPNGQAYANLRLLVPILYLVTILHLLGAGLSGGKLRHFIWPLLVPYYSLSGLLKKFLRLRPMAFLVQVTIGRLFPRTVSHYFVAQRLSDWFVPALLWRHFRQKTLLPEASARFWDFLFSLRLANYFGQGFVAFAGMLLWFVGPTSLILIATRSAVPAVQAMFFIAGIFSLLFVLAYFPLVHARYCSTLDWRSYTRWRTVGRGFRFSPARITIALFFSVLLCTPLWLTRVAMIPFDLWWILSLVYVTLLWPTWLLWGWAWHHAQLGLVRNRILASPEKLAYLFDDGKVATRACRWYWIWSWRTVFVSVLLLQWFMTIISIYICWQGVFNVLFHPMFNIPTPFSPNA